MGARLAPFPPVVRGYGVLSLQTTLLAFPLQCTSNDKYIWRGVLLFESLRWFCIPAGDGVATAVNTHSDPLRQPVKRSSLQVGPLPDNVCALCKVKRGKGCFCWTLKSEATSWMLEDKVCSIWYCVLVLDMCISVLFCWDCSVWFWHLFQGRTCKEPVTCKLLISGTVFVASSSVVFQECDCASFFPSRARTSELAKQRGTFLSMPRTAQGAFVSLPNGSIAKVTLIFKKSCGIWAVISSSRNLTLAATALSWHQKRY